MAYTYLLQENNPWQ